VHLHLVSPRAIDGPQTLGSEGGHIEREVGDKNVVTVEDKAIRPEKAYGRTIAVDPAEVAEPGDHPALRRLEHEDLIGLIARNPDVVVVVNDKAVRSAAGAVDEDLGLPRLKRRGPVAMACQTSSAYRGLRFRSGRNGVRLLLSSRS
jgi:hypothetical protein